MTTANPTASLPATSGKERRLDPRTLGPLVRKELRDSLRNRWFVLYALAFAALSVALAYVAQVGTGLAGMAGYGKTAASIVNLTLLLVPLMAISMGAFSLSTDRDRGMLAYVLAQPVTRAEVYLSKFVGQTIAFTGAIALGFGVSAAFLSAHGAVDGLLFARLAGLSALLAASMLAIGMAIAACVRRSAAALGLAILAWSCVTLFGDLGLMGATSFLDLGADELLWLSLLNPAQVFKLASIAGFDSTLDLLGPAGLYAVRTFGAALTGVLVTILAAWVVLPLCIGLLVFVRRPL